MIECRTVSPLRDAPGTRTMAGITGAVLLCVVSAGAFGATNLVDCQEFGHGPQGHATATAPFTISLVDLPGKENELGLTESIDAVEAAAESESSAPFLYLTPRVATMFREVFEEEAIDNNSSRKPSSPPVAKGNSEKSALQNLEEADLNDADDARPRFRYRMYRTDI